MIETRSDCAKRKPRIRKRCNHSRRQFGSEYCMKHNPFRDCLVPNHGQIVDKNKNGPSISKCAERISVSGYGRNPLSGLIMQFSIAECGEIPEPPSIPHRERGVRGLLKHAGPPPQELYDHVVEKLEQKIGGGKKFKCHLPA